MLLEQVFILTLSQLESLVDNSSYIKEQGQLGRGCPTFERITLQPDGDPGWVSTIHLVVLANRRLCKSHVIRKNVVHGIWFL